MRLRFTGRMPVCFQVPGLGEVAPGAVFEVPDERAEGWLRRPDVEPAPPDPPEAAPPPRSRSKSKAAPEAAFSMPAGDGASQEK